MSSSEKNDNSCASCEFQDNISLLRETSFFSALPMEVLKVLAYLCTRETFKSGEYLFRQGDDDGCAIYIISGTANLLYAHGDRECTVRSHGVGTLLGSLSLLGRMPRLFSLAAVTDVNVLVLEREKFVKGIKAFPESLPKIFQSLTRSISDWEKAFLSGHAESCETCLKKTGVSVL